MALSYPLTFPDVTGVARVDFSSNTIVSSTRSIFSGATKTQKQPGQWWEAAITLPPLDADESAVWKAFIASLNGVEHTFLLGDPQYTGPRGAAASTPGTPVVKGASQLGQTLEIDGAPNNVTGYLKAWDYIQIGSGSDARLHAILVDADSDGSGNVTLELFPEIRAGEDPSDNAAIVLTDPVGNFRLTQNHVPFPAAPSGGGTITEISFNAWTAL